MGGRLSSQYLARRLAQALVTLLAVTLLLFGLLHAIPGGPLRSLLGEAVGADPAAAEQAEALLGLDRPPLERYAGWLGGVLRGDLGTSWMVAPGRPVWPLLWTALVNSLLLTTQDVPRSPTSSPPSQPRYRSSGGRSRPSSASACSAAAGSAPTASPSRLRSGPPGIAWSSPNSSSVTASSVTSAWASRRARKREVTMTGGRKPGAVD